MRKNSIKNTRINGEVRRELSNIILNEIKDPRICPMTSVVEVEVAPDLKTAKAYISVLGDKQAQADTPVSYTHLSSSIFAMTSSFSSGTGSKFISMASSPAASKSSSEFTVTRCV